MKLFEYVKKRRWWVTALLVLLLLVGGSLAFKSKLGWRAELIEMKLRGDLVDMGWDEVAWVMLPANAAKMNVGGLIRHGNPNRAVVNQFDSPEDVAAGYATFRSRCAGCHGLDGKGTERGVSLTRSTKTDHRDLFAVVTEGIPGTSMNPADLSREEAWQVVSFIQVLRDSAAAEQAQARKERVPPPDVDYERLLRASEEPESWLTYGGTYGAHRFSSLDRITTSNIDGLEPLWIYQSPTVVEWIEATPLVVNGVMYFTDPPSDVVAVDAATGDELWRYEHDMPESVPACCGEVNRGLAVLGNRLFLGSLDAHLVALDAQTGQVLWNVELADHAQGYTGTGAPLAIDGKVVVGIAGGEYGIRGFLDAYDAETGERVWRFHTIPGPGEPGHDTWTGDSWRRGGAPTWVTGSYDPELDLVYWGIGNPGPPWNGEVRKGDNLFSNSVVALDGETGELRWYFQFTPHDEHDWDATQVPVLLDARYEGRPRKLMAFANRNAFYYLLDRETGEYLLAEPFAKQTWAERIDAEGRPVLQPNSGSSPQGTLVYPAGQGATNWWAPSYNPGTGLLYVPSIPESSQIFYQGPADYEPGEVYLGSAIQETTEEPLEIAITAIEPLTGEVRWRQYLPGTVGRENRKVGSTLTTGGGLVFAGSAGTLVGLDARDGREVWRFTTGGTIAAAPVTYMVDGRQQLTLPAGRSIYTFVLDRE